MTNALSTAIYAILESIIRVMIRNGVAFGELSQLAKKAYINVAEQELIRSGQKSTISMVAISTGLTRKEVSALKKEITPVSETKAPANRAVRVVSAWISDPAFCDVSGKAKVLDIQGENDSFEQLVNRHSGDMPYRAMIKELLRIGIVEEKSNGKIALLRAAYIPSASNDQKYGFLGDDASALINTISHNILDDEDEPFFQRKVCYYDIPEEHVDAFKTLSNQENQTLLEKYNTWLAKHSHVNNPELKSSSSDDTQKSQSPKLKKVGVGIYYFESNAEQS